MKERRLLEDCLTFDSDWLRHHLLFIFRQVYIAVRMLASFAPVLAVELFSDYHALILEFADSTSAFGNHHIFATQPPQFQQMKLTPIQVNTHLPLFLRFLFHTFDTLGAAVIFCFMKAEFRFWKTQDLCAQKNSAELVVQLYRKHLLGLRLLRLG